MNGKESKKLKETIKSIKKLSRMIYPIPTPKVKESKKRYDRKKLKKLSIDEKQ